jgi:hypothetical protein
LLAQKNLILVRDLNLTLSSGEIWGGASSSGLLASFFKTFFHNNKLIDIVRGIWFPPGEMVDLEQIILLKG